MKEQTIIINVDEKAYFEDAGEKLALFRRKVLNYIAKQKKKDGMKIKLCFEELK